MAKAGLGRIWVLASAGAVASAALAVGAITSASPGASAAPSPLSTVISALTRTSAQSYTFSLDTTVRLPRKEMNSDLVSGAYDPEQHLGTEALTARAAKQTTRAQIRFVGAYLYTSVTPRSGFGKPWDRTPLTATEGTGMPPGDLYGFVSDQVVSPSVLISVLRSGAAAVHVSGPVSGPGWTGTGYIFTARFGGRAELVSGTVDVDGHGRVRCLTSITTVKMRNGPETARLTTLRDITFGDFGSPVRVNTPPATQVKSTSGQPYWGFYF